MDVGEEHCRIVTVIEMQLGFMPAKGTIAAESMLNRLQEEHRSMKNIVQMYCRHGESARKDYQERFLNRQ